MNIGLRASTALVISVLTTAPAAHAQMERGDLRPDASWSSPSRTTTAFTLRSELLGEQRRLFVSLPESHAATERSYPLVLVFDGEAIHGQVVAAADALVDAGHMPETVIVGIENTDRLRDFAPPDMNVSGVRNGRADRFADFIAEELRPALASAFRADGPVILVGHSSGGLFAYYAATYRPAVFGNVVALDAPMHLEDGALARELATLSVDAPLRLVSIDARFGWPDVLWTEYERAVPATWSVYRETLESETHQSVVWPGSYRGLKTLFAAYSSVTLSGGSPVARLAEFRERNPFGPTAAPPRPLLRSVVEDRTEARDPVAARDALRELEQSYGPSPLTERLAARIDEAETDGLEGPSIDVLRATPLASADEARAVLGRWEGVVGGGTPVVIEIRDVGGSVEGEIGVGGEPPRPIEYLTVDGATVHVGNVNGMRPRGMLMYEGEVDGDVYEGIFALRGVVFLLPNGEPPPPADFRLVRVSR